MQCNCRTFGEYNYQFSELIQHRGSCHLTQSCIIIFIFFFPPTSKRTKYCRTYVLLVHLPVLINVSSICSMHFMHSYEHSKHLCSISSRPREKNVIKRNNIDKQINCRCKSNKKKKDCHLSYTPVAYEHTCLGYVGSSYLTPPIHPLHKNTSYRWIALLMRT